jgi:hypothetical protein
MQGQNVFYLAMNGMFASQTTFLFNQIQSVWESAPDGVNGVARLGIKTYTNSLMDSMNEVRNQRRHGSLT